MDALGISIREFRPREGDWRPLESLFERVFSSSAPSSYYSAIFTLFERFPKEDGAGVLWSALHGRDSKDGRIEGARPKVRSTI